MRLSTLINFSNNNHRILRLLPICLLFSLSAILTSCSPAFVSYFPVQSKAGASLLALNEGKLQLENGCLRSHLGDISYLLIWPPGYSYHVSGNRVNILNEQHVIVASTGEFKVFTGGEITSIAQYIGVPPLGNCAGPYWLVSDISESYIFDPVRWLFDTISVVVFGIGMFGLWMLARDRLKKS